VTVERGGYLVGKLSKLSMSTIHLSFTLNARFFGDFTPGSVSLLVSTTAASCSSHVPAEISWGIFVVVFQYDYPVVTGRARVYHHGRG